MALVTPDFQEQRLTGLGIAYGAAAPGKVVAPSRWLNRDRRENGDFDHFRSHLACVTTSTSAIRRASRLRPRRSAGPRL
jgi:hypothetical protein